MENKWKVILLVVWMILVLGGIAYVSFKPASKISGFIAAGTETKLDSAIVTKVIDGDTLIVTGGKTLRLLGIDTDEKGYPCYNEAKERLEELVLGKEVALEKDGEDKDIYDRYLRYVFLNEENVNLRLVGEGLAVARYTENLRYEEHLIQAEKNAIGNKVGCKWGKQEKIELKEVQEEIPEVLVDGVVPVCDAWNYVGQEKVVQGKIVGAYNYQGKVIFLNFEQPYPNSCFTGIIWASDLHKFPENVENYYEGKTARVNGKIVEYEGKIEIILKNPEQIEIL